MIHNKTNNCLNFAMRVSCKKISTVITRVYKTLKEKGTPVPEQIFRLIWTEIEQGIFGGRVYHYYNYQFEFSLQYLENNKWYFTLRVLG